MITRESVVTKGGDNDRKEESFEIIDSIGVWPVPNGSAERHCREWTKRSLR
jgi:hypothetical protein